MSPAACVALRLEPEGLVATVASAGHPAPIVLRRDGQTEELDCRGPLIGIADDVRFPETVATLGPGDAIVLYTDGVIEARVGGDLFGQQRLHDVLRPLAGAGAQELADAIVTAAEHHGAEANDDIAVLVVRLPLHAG
jgi:sigma-B regulation protein RsbU (phosphoserine phosphatase)